MWLAAYTSVWTATVAPAIIVRIVGRPLAAPSRRALALTLSAQRNPAPHASHVLALAAHNIPIASWPLLLGLLGAEQHRLGKRVADGLLLACVAANALPVGVALGAYGTRVLPYLPQLPLEWAGLALGAAGWIAQRRSALANGQRLGLLVLIIVVLTCAAIMETVAVPHR